MCISPIRINNNSKYVNLHGFYGTMQVPCGRCPECMDSRHANYKARCYYESLGTLKKGGFCIFDTLTYAPKYLPHINGVPCFNHDDIVRFRKRLRIYLQRSGWTISDEVEEHLRMFIVSEYGSTTHRPHYHLIAWSTIPDKIDSFGNHRKFCPWDLHQAIRKNWKYGFTDKMLKVIDLKKDGIGAIFYVTKYMQKSTADVTSLNADLQTFLDSLDDDEARNSFMKEYRKYFQLRCWSSNGLGMYFINLLETDPQFLQEFEKTGMVRVPSADKKKVYDYVSLGHYYTYKLFYDRVFNPETNRKDKFVISKKGIDFKVSRLEDNIEKVAAAINIARSLVPVEIASRPGLYTGSSISDRELAIYSLVYRGLNVGFEEDLDFVDSSSYSDLYRYVLNPDLKTTSLNLSSREYADYCDKHYLYQYFKRMYDCEVYLRMLEPYFVEAKILENSENERKKHIYDLFRTALINKREIVDYQ